MELGHELDEDSKNQYSKITWDAKGIEELLCQLFLDSFEKPPETLILDFDAADIPIHGDQQRRFFTDITITTAAFLSMCSVMIFP